MVDTITRTGTINAALSELENFQSLNKGCSQSRIHVMPAVLAIFKSDDRANEGIAPSLDVGDVSIAKLAVP
jgi:hypothetical protein